MMGAGVLTRIDAVGFVLAKQLLSLSWQFVLLSVMALIAGWVLKRTSAGIRHRIWTTVFVIVPLIPLLVIAAGRVGTPRVEVRVIPSYKSPGPLKTILPSDIESPVMTMVNDEPESRYRYPWARALILYGLCAGGLLGLITLGRLRLEYCRRTGCKIRDRRLRDIFTDVRSRLDISRPIILVESDLISSPLTIGTFRPAVIMPTGFSESLSDDDIRAFATHELAHVKRFDSLLLFYVSVVRALMFFNPAVWFATRQLCLIAEHACDDMVVATDNAPLNYAEMLVRIARGFSASPPSADLAAGFFITNHQFLYRIEQIVDDRHERITALTKRALTGYLASGLAAVFLVVAVPIGEIPHIDLKTVYDAIPIVRTMVFKARVIDPETGDPIQGVHLYREDEPTAIVSNENGYIEMSGVEPGVTMFHVASRPIGPGRPWADDIVPFNGRVNARRPPHGSGQHPFGAPPNKQVTILIEPDMTVTGTVYNPDRIETLTHMNPGLAPYGAARPDVSVATMALDITDIETPTTILVMPNMNISGTVYDPEGRPVSGATVVPARTGTGNSISGDMRYNVRTDSNGRYTIYLPASGEALYNLMAFDTANGGVQTWANGVTEPLKTKSGVYLEHYDIVLSSPSSVSGQVVDADGNPLADRMVMAFTLDGLSVSQYEPYARTDADGQFEITHIRTGEIRVMLMHESDNGICKPEATEGSMLSLTIDGQSSPEPIMLVDTGSGRDLSSPSARSSMIRMIRD